VRLGQLLGCALEFVPLGDLEVSAELVEQAAQEDALDRKAGEAEVARWLEPDFLERCRQVVLDVAGGELAKRLRPGDGRLARVGKVGDGPAKLLDCREAE